MITDCSSQSVITDTQVSSGARTEGTVPGSPAWPGIVPAPGRRDPRSPASGAHRRRSWGSAGAVTRAGSGAGLRARPGRVRSPAWAAALAVRSRPPGRARAGLAGGPCPAASAGIAVAGSPGRCALCRPRTIPGGARGTAHGTARRQSPRCPCCQCDSPCYRCCSCAQCTAPWLWQGEGPRFDSVTGLQINEVFRTTQTTGVERVARDTRQPHRQHPWLPWHRNGPAGGAEGSRQWSFHGGFLWADPLVGMACASLADCDAAAGQGRRGRGCR